VRYADDFVMTFETYQDAKRVMEVSGKRLGLFGLKLHPDKTRFIDFHPQRHGGTPPDCRAQSFDVLGFTHSWGSRGRARTWCGKQRLRVDLPARWPRSRTRAGPTGIGPYANSAPGCLRSSKSEMSADVAGGGSRGAASGLLLRFPATVPPTHQSTKFPSKDLGFSRLGWSAYCRATPCATYACK
jgi:Reverse transcriptase (RNA-dependent DNA polymerase)